MLCLLSPVQVHNLYKQISSVFTAGMYLYHIYTYYDIHYMRRSLLIFYERPTVAPSASPVPLDWTTWKARPCQWHSLGRAPARAPPTVAPSMSPVPIDWTKWRVRTVLVLWARPDLEEEDPASFGTAVVAQAVVVDRPPRS